MPQILIYSCAGIPGSALTVSLIEGIETTSNDRVKKAQKNSGIVQIIVGKPAAPIGDFIVRDPVAGKYCGYVDLSFPDHRMCF